jgi:hypothetical protein
LAALTAREQRLHGRQARIDVASNPEFLREGNAVDDARTALAAQQLWERCRDATSVPLRGGGLVPLGESRYNATIAPALSEHDEHRLRGCLEDTHVDRVLLTVVEITALGR